MSVEAALVTELELDAAVAAIVGAKVIQGVANEEDILPFITITLRIGNREKHFLAASGLAEKTYQITAWQADPGDAVTLAEAVREALDGFFGTLGAGGNTADVKRVSIDGDQDLYDPEYGNNTGAYGRAVDATIWHVETVPTFS